MKISNATIDIRPRTTGELIDLSMLFYRKHFGILFALTAIFAFPSVVIAAAVHYLFQEPLFAFATLMLLMPLTTGAIVLAASRIVFNMPVTVAGVFSKYKTSWARYYGRRLWESAVSAITLPIIVGYILHLSYSYTAPVVLLEQLRGRDLGIRRRGLLRRGGGSSFAFDLVMMLVFLALMAGIICIFELSLGTIFSLWQETGLRTFEVFDDPVRMLIWMTAGAVVYPIYSLGWFFRYLDARIRAEGWDLELEFRSAAAKHTKGEAK